MSVVVVPCHRTFYFQKLLWRVLLCLGFKLINTYSRSAANKLLGNSNIRKNMVDHSILVGKMYTHKDSVLYRQQLIQIYVVRCFEPIVLHYNIRHRGAIDMSSSGKRKRDDFEVVNWISKIVEKESNHNKSPSCENSINFVNETEYNLS